VSDIIQIPNQRQGKPLGKAYELMLNSIGTEEFGSTVRECLMSVAGGIRRVYLFEATGPDTSTLQYFSCEPRLIELLPAYSQSYIRMDPVRDAYSAAPAAGDMALLRIRPCDIPTPGFRRRFFEDCGIVERLSIIQRGHEAWRVINIARHASNGCFSNVEIDALVELASLALPMLPLNRRDKLAGVQLTVAQLEDRFASRYGGLTARERQVCARAAIGMSVEATALDLGVAKTSVLTYRRRAYGRLKVTSPYELCALVTH